MNIDLAKVHAQKLGQPNLSEHLVAMPFNSLVPILVDTMARKSEQISAIELLREAEMKSAFFAPSNIAQKELCQFQQFFFSSDAQEF